MQRRGIALLLLMLCLSLQMPSHAARAPSESELKRIKQEIQSAQERIRQGVGQETTLQKNLKEAETSLGKLQRELSLLKKKINTLEKELKALATESARLEQEKNATQAQIAALVNTRYRLGEGSRLKILLNQEEPGRIERLLAYSDYFNRALADAIEQHKATLVKIEESRIATEAKRQDLLASRDSLAKQKKELQKSHATRSQSLKQLHAGIRTERQKLQQLEQDRKQLEALLRRVNTNIPRFQMPDGSIPFPKSKGKLIWPTQGRLDNRYGTSRSSGGLPWQGVSFHAPAGQDVLSVHNGRVLFADWFRGKGLLLIIDHGEGYMTLYAHNQLLLKEAGDWVSAGEKIATVGNSGGLEQPELYFEIRFQGEPVSPVQWFKH